MEIITMDVWWLIYMNIRRLTISVYENSMFAFKSSLSKI